MSVMTSPSLQVGTNFQSMRTLQQERVPLSSCQVASTNEACWWSWVAMPVWRRGCLGARALGFQCCCPSGAGKAVITRGS